MGCTSSCTNQWTLGVRGLRVVLYPDLSLPLCQKNGGTKVDIGLSTRLD